MSIFSSMIPNYGFYSIYRASVGIGISRIRLDLTLDKHSRNRLINPKYLLAASYSRDPGHSLCAIMYGIMAATAPQELFGVSYRISGTLL